jgi:hypothetical protein
MHQAKLKPRWSYLTCRIYAPIVWAGSMIFTVIWCISLLAGHDPWPVLTIAFLIIFPLFGAAVFMLQQLFVFPAEYSCFGRLARTPFPNEAPVLVIKNSWGAVSIFKASVPFFIWYLYPSGLGISVFGVGKAFIPTDRIIEVIESQGLEKYFYGPYTLRHSSTELLSPVYFPDKRLFDALQLRIPHRR